MVGSSPSNDPHRLEHLVAHIQDAVVEFILDDGEPIVRDVNPAFTEIFGYDVETIKGESLNEFIVPPWLSAEALELDERTRSGEVNYRRVTRQTADGLRELLYRGIPFEDDRNGGFAVYTDLTEGLRKERRLDVLNRILRHNLRNKVTVIEGGTERLLAELDDEPSLAELAASVHEASAELRGLAAKATEIQRTLDESLPSPASVDAASLIRETAGNLRETYPPATIETELPAELEVVASDRLQFAIAALVENAIEHNPADEPHVWIRARTVLDGEWADIVVEDQGPAIPATERDIVTGDRDITPTAHGSGLGLWLAKWTVEKYGGDLAFEENVPEGNRVRMRMQRSRGDSP